MINEQFAIQSRIDIVQLLNSIGESDRYINDHRDKYHYIIHKINEGSVFNKNNAEGFVNLNLDTLRSFLGRRYADRILKELLQWNIIECDGIQKQGHKSYGYRIHPDYISKTILVDIFKTETMGRKLKVQRAEYQSQHKKDVRWKNLTQLQIRFKDALSYIEAQRDISLEKAQQSEEIATVEAKYTTDLESIRKLRDGEYFLEQPDPSSRVYTNLSNLSSELRQFLYHRKSNVNLVNLDIANSQPYLFSLLLTDFYKNQELPEDVQKYIELTSKGEFYEYLMDKLNISPTERKTFKVDFFAKVFFCSSFYSKRTQEGQFFAQEFPSVTGVVEHYKEAGRAHYYDKKYFRHLSISMQRQEAEIILGTVGKKLEKTKVWYSTIHDSVVCLEEHSETVKSLILDAFLNSVGIPPTIKAEVLQHI